MNAPEKGKEASDDRSVDASAGPLPKIIRFEELVVCGDEVWIQFQGQIYRLRRTKHDKLILTK